MGRKDEGWLTKRIHRAASDEENKVTEGLTDDE